ncbi:unnamed protein product [Amoebophrya sp. A25]|nr:unnamed protein product [Amoebophrya sp. A25]|eukprot:GSA25T00027175001.1
MPWTASLRTPWKGYQPGGVATLNRIIRDNPSDNDLDHLAKCARMCADYVATGSEGCAGFVYEKQDRAPLYKKRMAGVAVPR